jgi:hypothetical protein
MIMTAVAKAVHRGTDGSVHYLMSTRENSLLVVTDPVLGVDKIRLDGPCRQTAARPDGPVQYEAIGTKGSTLVWVNPGQPTLISEYGFCVSC